MTQAQPDPARGAEVHDLDRTYVFHSWSAQAPLNPMGIAGAEGSYVWDYDGKRYLDFSSQLVNVNIGHQHPKVVAAIQAQAARLSHRRAAARQRRTRRGREADRRAGFPQPPQGVLHQRRRRRHRERHPDGTPAHRPYEGALLLPQLSRQHRLGDQRDR